MVQQILDHTRQELIALTREKRDGKLIANFYKDGWFKTRKREITPEDIKFDALPLQYLIELSEKTERILGSLLQESMPNKDEGKSGR